MLGNCCKHMRSEIRRNTMKWYVFCRFGERCRHSREQAVRSMYCWCVVRVCQRTRTHTRRSKPRPPTYTLLRANNGFSHYSASSMQWAVIQIAAASHADELCTWWSPVAPLPARATFTTTLQMKDGLLGSFITRGDQTSILGMHKQTDLIELCTMH